MIIAKALADITNQVSTGDDTVVLFTNPKTCAPCRALKPHWDKLDTLTTETLVYVDLDTLPDAALLYRVQSVPTLMLFVDGVFVTTLAGRTVLQLKSELARD